MQGVEILTSAQVVTERTTNWTAFWIMCTIIFAIFLVVGIKQYLKYYDISDIIGFSLVGIVFGSLGGVLIGCGALSTPADYETHYKVTISEEVSMANFYQYYEVIGQDGKIFIVREKTNER